MEGVRLSGDDDRNETPDGRLRIEERVDCEECGRPGAGGERRRYAKEQVLFGTVIARPGEGENVYCPACADGIARESDVDAKRERALERA